MCFVIVLNRPIVVQTWSGGGGGGGLYMQIKWTKVWNEFKSLWEKKYQDMKPLTPKLVKITPLLE